MPENATCPHSIWVTRTGLTGDVLQGSAKFDAQISSNNISSGIEGSGAMNASNERRGNVVDRVPAGSRWQNCSNTILTRSSDFECWSGFALLMNNEYPISKRMQLRLHDWPPWPGPWDTRQISQLGTRCMVRRLD